MGRDMEERVKDVYFVNYSLKSCSCEPININFLMYTNPYSFSRLMEIKTNKK